MTENPSVRRRTMQAVRAKHTKPEMLVRSLVHRLGYRFRLHRSDLPGKPDLAFVSRRKVICVNGCFWHGHGCARGAREPKTNVEYWQQKIAGNKKRDTLNKRLLDKQGWRSLIVWECQLKNKKTLEARLSKFLRL